MIEPPLHGVQRQRPQKLGQFVYSRVTRGQLAPVITEGKIAGQDQLVPFPVQIVLLWFGHRPDIRRLIVRWP